MKGLWRLLLAAIVLVLTIGPCGIPLYKRSGADDNTPTAELMWSQNLDPDGINVVLDVNGISHLYNGSFEDGDAYWWGDPLRYRNPLFDPPDGWWFVYLGQHGSDDWEFGQFLDMFGSTEPMYGLFCYGVFTGEYDGYIHDYSFVDMWAYKAEPGQGWWWLLDFIRLSNLDETEGWVCNQYKILNVVEWYRDGYSPVIRVYAYNDYDLLTAFWYDDFRIWSEPFRVFLPLVQE